MSTLLSLINADNYRTYSLHIAKKLNSVNAAIVLSELIQRHEYHQKNNALIKLRNKEGDWFYFTQEKCEERTALTRTEQENAFAVLIKHELIFKVQAGLPAKRHFQLNQLKIFELMIDSKNLSSLQETCNLDSGKPANNDVGNLQSTKETKKETLSKRTTNYPKKKVSSSFSIDRNLEYLEDLPLEKAQKDRIYSDFDDITIFKAVQVYLSRKSEPDDLGAFLYSACKRGYKKGVSKEELFKANQSIADNTIRKWDNMREHNGYRVMILSKHVEFISGQVVTCIAYDDPDFKNKLKSWAIKVDPSFKI